MNHSQALDPEFDRVYDLRPQPELTQENREISVLFAQLQTLPLGTPAFRQAMANVYQHLQTASRALALACGISSEFRYLPDVWGLPELNIFHGRFLVPMSYHLNTALGAAEILAAGRGRTPYFPLMVGCMLATVRLWQRLPEAIDNLRRAAGPRHTATVNLTEQTSRTIAVATQQGLMVARSSVSTAQWNVSVRASELAHSVREKVSQMMAGESY
ncbi:hypothetical protein E5161_07000 [Cohnella pontilimi]|uniref:Uncharacterized protein n=1 Tax=Cohnella pontilimi TaxID=2564100 RepID=A0A4U0FE89_9BACL|nr:hypothetical protein [Cohnella pontilimi]TJY42594.1 hypothetical protein E5161_07000 [Cohnella pontilimi]